MWPRMPKLPKIMRLLYVKKEVSDEVDFLYVDQLEGFLQSDTMIFDGDGQVFPKSPLNNKFAMFLQYLKREVRNEVDFLHGDKHQSFL